jgi:hypothetical protein
VAALSGIVALWPKLTFTRLAPPDEVPADGRLNSDAG